MPNSYLEVFKNTVPLQMTNLQQVTQTLANCQQRIVSFSRTIYIFLKVKKKKNTSNIYGAFLK